MVPRVGWYRWPVSSRPTPFPRALFFDLDGTLLAPGAILTRRTIEAVRDAAACGAAIVLATGGFSARTHLLARTLAGTVPGGVWTVTHNGAGIWDPNGRLVHHHPMPLPALEAALAQAGPRVWVTYEVVDHEPAEGTTTTAVYYAGRLRRELAPFLWGPPPLPPAPADGHSAPDPPSGLPTHERPSAKRATAAPPPDTTTAAAGIAVGLEPRWDWRRARSAETYRRGVVLGCWCIGPPEALAPLDAQADGEALYGARYIPWGWRLGHLLGRPRLRLVGRDLGSRTASKGAAAAWLCQRLGIDATQTAAFGDGDNDLELLAFAGLAVAMANATPRALGAAGLIAPSNTEDGVAHVLQGWLAGPLASRP